ncbi:MAG TPA: response regulator [Cyclobacteriaceae bacterium]|nr:response regulator [Cyclobacteriaceae bacterium]
MKNKRVLIVDDNALNRKVFENIIGYSYLFDVATNGLEAIDLIKRAHYDIILMDIQMPKLDGISALKIIKAENLTLSPIIAISAYSNQADRDYFLSTGFDDFMAKPVRPRDLLEAIHHYVSKSTMVEGNTGTEHYSDLDESIMEKLMKYNTIENIKTVYLDFLEEAEGLVEEIKYLIENNTFSEIHEKLHILKGNSGTLGAQKLFKASVIFENKIKNADFEGIMQENLLLEKHLIAFRKNLEEQKIF